jgi:phospholipase/carboxylesterase
MNQPDTETIELLSASVPKQLFVLLHDEGGTAADMLALGNVLGDAFANAAILIPEGLTRVEALPALLLFVRAQQERFGILQSDTALAGLGSGADLALALSDSYDGVVGRVLAFGAAYPGLPESFQTPPALSTLHLLHGQDDRRAPVALAQAGFDRLMDRGADATLDVAHSLGHELHPALMEQAVTRLQTCVPLRYWRSA